MMSPQSIDFAIMLVAKRRDLKRAPARKRESTATRKGQKEGLVQERDTARRSHAELEREVKKHNDLQAELDALYNLIFAGPTPYVPGEDAREWAFRKARDAFDATKQRSEAESQVVKILEDANELMQQSVEQLAETVDRSTLVRFGSHTSKDMGDWDALKRAQNAMDKVHRLVAQAQRFSSDTRDLGLSYFLLAYTASDNFLDDIFNDVTIRDKISQTQSQCQKASKKLRGLVVSAKERREQSRLEADEASERLVSCSSSAKNHLQGLLSFRLTRRALRFSKTFEPCLLSLG